MSIYRKILLLIAGTLFRFVLFFSISVSAIVILYSDTQYIKSVLIENNVYNRFVSSIIESNKDQKISSGQSVKLGDPAIQSVIMTAFPPEILKNVTETIIDGGYSWLEGESPELQFSIDLTENKQKLAEGLSQFAITRLKSMPYCAQYTSNIDPFSAECQPRTFNFEQEQAALTQQLVEQTGFLENPIITQEIITKSNQDELVQQDIEKLPDYYQFAKLIPIGAVIFLIINGVLIVLISKNKRYGLWRVGRALASTGVTVIVFTIIFSFIVPRFSGSLPILQTTGEGIDSLLNDTALDFGRDYAILVLKIALPISILGAVFVFYSKKREQKFKFKNLGKKSGIISSNEPRRKSVSKSKIKPPIQSSESSDTKPARKTKNKNYRKIPKKEI